MKLPILVSVPHAGTQIPAELKALTHIAMNDVVKDGDEQAAEIYLPLPRFGITLFTW
jgi:N-formylglutamate amidohydrolase